MPPADHPEWIPNARRALGARIRARRLHRNLTQEQVAERSGLDRSTIQRIEGGLNDVRYSHLLRIAQALDTTVAALVE